jgi:hypothetical protein
MNWNHWIRQIHRWVAVVFTLSVVVVAIVLSQPNAAIWVSYVPLLPLALLLLTGLYLFVLPYALRWRSKRGISAT